jgi:hypothetical protein
VPRADLPAERVAAWLEEVMKRYRWMVFQKLRTELLHQLVCRAVENGWTPVQVVVIPGRTYSKVDFNHPYPGQRTAPMTATEDSTVLLLAKRGWLRHQLRRLIDWLTGRRK